MGALGIAGMIQRYRVRIYDNVPWGTFPYNERSTSSLEALLRSEDEDTEIKRSERKREIKGDFKNERGRIKEEDGERREEERRRMVDTAWNERKKNVMERQRSILKEVTQCSRQFVLPLQHLWTLLAALSTCSFTSASCCYCKKRHWEKELCVHVFMCCHVYVNARLLLSGG